MTKKLCPTINKFIKLFFNILSFVDFNLEPVQRNFFATQLKLILLGAFQKIVFIPAFLNTVLYAEDFGKQTDTQRMKAPIVAIVI